VVSAVDGWQRALVFTGCWLLGFQMIAKNAVIFFYHRLNSYSFNALAGAIDADPALSDLPVDIALTEEQLRTLAAVRLNRHGHVTAAISILTCQVAGMRRLIRQLRADCGSNITIIAGGPHVTACAEEVLGAGADIAVRGEAEGIFPNILESIGNGQEIHGIQSPENSVDLDAYASFSPKRGMFGPIEITRGCAFACSYCQTSHIFGVKLRHRSIGNIVRQAEMLQSINRKVVRLLSPNAFSYGSPDGRQLHYGAMHELLAALRKTLTSKGRIIFAHFPSEARPEHITPDTLDLLKEFANNDEIVIGAQSGSPRMLDRCHRSHTVDDVLSAVSLARKRGYKVIVDFIFGLPGENEKDRQESLAVMERVVRMGARVHPHLFAPLPQTAFAKEQPGSISPDFELALENFKSQRGIYQNQPKRIRAINFSCSENE
jgi:B12-binding domain/radical SAM domain protein